MIIKFIKFLEKYLTSNNAPLYHFTSTFPFNEIIREDKIKVGYYENSYYDKKLYVVSLTRDKNFTNYRKSNIRFELDKNKLKNNYKIIPYDYFIHSKIEKYPKSNLKRVKEIEFEEIILDDKNNK